MVGHRPLLWPGIAALVATPGLAIVAVAALLGAASDIEAGSVLNHYTLRILRFAVIQATLSTLLSLVFAIPVARAFARRPVFPGRTLLIRLMGLPLVMPVIVAVFGIAAVWGQNGAVSHGLQALGFPGLTPLYGLVGILIAHVFFNMPLGVRLLLPVWEAIPGENWRLAGQVGMKSWAIFRLIELPRLASAVPGVATLIFLLCFTSFAAVLALGGGPKWTTLEVAIYYAMRLDFDIVRAVGLALLQVVICAAVALVLLKFSWTSPSVSVEGRAIVRPDAFSRTSLVTDAGWILVGGLWVAGPLAAILIAGVAGPVSEVLGRQNVWLATVRTVAVGIGAGMMAVVLGTMLAATTRDVAVRAKRPQFADRLELFGSQTLIVSPIVLGAGLFVLLLPFVPVFNWALPLAALVNGLIAVPYVLRLVGPVLRRNAEHHDRLCGSLGLSGWSRVRHLEWPIARPQAVTALALTSALAAGDLTAIALFGTGRDATLSLLLYQALGSYRMGEAGVLALLLLGTCLAIFVVIERFGNVRARA